MFRISSLAFLVFLLLVIVIATTRVDSASTDNGFSAHALVLKPVTNTVQQAGTTPVGITVPSLTDAATGVIYTNIFCNISQMIMAFNRDLTNNVTMNLDCYASQTAWSSGKAILVSHSISLGSSIVVQTRGLVLSTYPPISTATPTAVVRTPAVTVVPDGLAAAAAAPTPTPFPNQYATWFGPGVYGTGDPRVQAYNMLITVAPFTGSTIVTQ